MTSGQTKKARMAEEERVQLSLDNKDANACSKEKTRAMIVMAHLYWTQRLLERGI